MRANFGMRANITMLGMLVLFPLLPCRALAAGRPLSMRAADRAIDLAFQAELAGDRTGARDALLQLVESSTQQEDAAGRDWIDAWRSAESTRDEAFKKYGRTARAYEIAHGTLKGFGLKRSTALWADAVRTLPKLTGKESSTVLLRMELLRGAIDREETVALLGAELLKNGVVLQSEATRTSGAKAMYEARLTLEATDVETVERGFRVTALASMVILRSDRGHATPDLAGSIAKRRRELRTKEPDARRVALRRVLVDVAEALVFSIRQENLASSQPL